MWLQRNQRICEVCFREVEDETHVLLKCPAYNAAWSKLLQAAGVQQGGKDSKTERNLVVGAGWRKAKADNDFLGVMMWKGSKF